MHSWVSRLPPAWWIVTGIRYCSGSHGAPAVVPRCAGFGLIAFSRSGETGVCYGRYFTNLSAGIATSRSRMRALSGALVCGVARRSSGNPPHLARRALPQACRRTLKTGRYVCINIIPAFGVPRTGPADTPFKADPAVAPAYHRLLNFSASFWSFCSRTACSGGRRRLGRRWRRRSAARCFCSSRR